MFYHVANIGDARSRAIHPATTTHSQLTENELTITASDLESTLITSMELDNIEGEGTIAVPAKLLNDTLKEFPATGNFPLIREGQSFHKVRTSSSTTAPAQRLRHRLSAPPMN